jgi:hypothetical protein
MTRIALILRLAVFALIMLGATSAFAQSYPLYCRGGGSGTGGVFESGNNGVFAFNTTCIVSSGFTLSFVQGQVAERTASDPPQPGECRWADRGFNSNEPSNLWRIFQVQDCNREGSASVNFNFVNGTGTITGLDVFDSDRDWGFVWGLMTDLNQSYTLSVHSNGSDLVVDQFLCSGWCG